MRRLRIAETLKPLSQESYNRAIFGNPRQLIPAREPTGVDEMDNRGIDQAKCR